MWKAAFFHIQKIKFPEISDASFGYKICIHHNDILKKVRTKSFNTLF